MSIPIEKIKYGTKVVITDVSQVDVANAFRTIILGQLGTISENKNPHLSPIELDKNGWFRCTIYFEDNPLPLTFSDPFYFPAVKFRLATDEEIATAEQKKAEPETPDLSCSEIEFLVVLESARKWYMLREHPEWTNKDYFGQFPKDPRLYMLPSTRVHTSDCSCCSLWVEKCGNGKTNCPLDKKGLYCNSGSLFAQVKKHSSSNNSPWVVWYRNPNSGGIRRKAADKIFQAMIDWLVEHKHGTTEDRTKEDRYAPSLPVGF